MPFVLDASLALAWYFEDEVSEYADLVLERLREDSALVPSLWPLEIANGLISAERRGRIFPAGVARAAELVLELPISVQEVPPGLALGAVIDIARSQVLSAYDAAYLELAMREGVPLATRDDNLRAAAARVGVPLAE
jgi:predicted nucleic acid-binding protein